MRRTLVVTNDFPPRTGGIQTFVHEYVRRLPAGSVVVYTSSWGGAAEFDAQQTYPVVREPTKVLLPTRRVARRAAEIARTHGCDSVWFGAMAPLGLITPHLRRHSSIERAVATTHGHEVGWAQLPGARQMLQRIASSVDVVTYLGDYTRDRLAPVLGGRTRLERLTPGVDTEFFTPDADGARVRERYELGARPVVVCVSRLMPRKGQDALIRALPLVQQQVPGTALLLVGGGPYRRRLERLAMQVGVAADVVFTGTVPYDELPAHYAAGDVFAMPCRTRLGGVDVEGLGIVYLEASACGLPVVAGRSGGAPDALIDAVTGFLLTDDSSVEISQRLTTLLGDHELTRKLGQNGRNWVIETWNWDHLVGRLDYLLAGSGAD